MYVIQRAFVKGPMTMTDPGWQDFPRARRCVTLRGARKQFWKWANYPWIDNADSMIFRIYDTTTHKTIEP